jgi:hypothetical protein
MSANTDPAFPVSRQASASGITIRDYFAAAAMNGLLQGDTCNNEATGELVISTVTRKAYFIADQMMEERIKS